MLLGTWSRKMHHSAMPRQASMRRSRPSPLSSGGGSPTNGFGVSIRSCIWLPRPACEHASRGTVLDKEASPPPCRIVTTPGMPILRWRCFRKRHQFDEPDQPIALARKDNFVSELLAITRPAISDPPGITVVAPRYPVGSTVRIIRPRLSNRDEDDSEQPNDCAACSLSHLIHHLIERGNDGFGISLRIADENANRNGLPGARRRDIKAQSQSTERRRYQRIRHPSAASRSHRESLNSINRGQRSNLRNLRLDSPS